MVLISLFGAMMLGIIHYQKQYPLPEKRSELSVDGMFAD